MDKGAKDLIALYKSWLVNEKDKDRRRIMQEAIREIVQKHESSEQFTKEGVLDESEPMR